MSFIQNSSQLNGFQFYHMLIVDLTVEEEEEEIAPSSS
jgi:hypothetical protein